MNGGPITNGLSSKCGSSVTATTTANGVTEADLLALAGAAEADSEDVANLGYKGTGFASLTGRGVRATVHGYDVAVGGPYTLKELGLGTPANIAGTVQAWVDRGPSVLHVIRDNSVIGAVRSRTRCGRNPGLL